MKNKLLLLALAILGNTANAGFVDQPESPEMSLITDLEIQNQALQAHVQQISNEIDSLSQKIDEQYAWNAQEAAQKEGQERTDLEIKALEEKNRGLALLSDQIEKKEQLQSQINHNLNEMLGAIESMSSEDESIMADTMGDEPVADASVGDDPAADDLIFPDPVAYDEDENSEIQSV